MPDDRPPARWLIQTAQHDSENAATAVESRRAMARADADPSDLVERFEEIAELGRGGMGRVFTANDRLLGRVVAVKQALSDDANVLARFSREIQIAAQLQHPNLLPILDAGTDDRGRPFFVMNKIDGRSLESAIGDADVRARLAFVPNVAAVVDAVAYAHASGVIHRDIKPANVLIGSFGESLLIDWGIARVLDDPETAPPPGAGSTELTQHGWAMGTPGFMPPEQARGEPAGCSADVYGLGGTLYYLLAGKRPFQELAATAAIAAAAADQGPDFSAIGDEVPVDLVAIVKRAMAPRAADRYPNAGALAADLRAFLAGQLVAAHDYSIGERLGRWVRKHRLVVAIIAMAVVVTAVIAVIALHNVISARTDAVAARTDAEDRLIALLETLAPSAPEYAVAKLAELPPSSPVWTRARAVVTSALAAGATRGLELGTVFAQPSPRPDGHEVALVDAGRRAIRFVDPGLSSSGSLHTLDAEIAALQWTDDGAGLLASTKDGVLYLERSTLSSRRLETGSTSHVELIGGGVILVDRTLRMLDLAGGPPRELAADVKVAARIAGATLFMRDQELAIVLDAGPITTVATDVRAIGVHPKQTRFAYATGDAIVDVAMASGHVTERGRYPVSGGVSRLIYSGDALLAQIDGSLHVFANGAWRRIGLDRALTSVAWQPDGAYGVLAHEIAWITPDGAIPLVHGNSVFHYAVVAGDFLLAIDRRGTLRSWPRQRLLHARPLPVRRVHAFAGIDDERVVITGIDETGARAEWQVSLETLETTKLAAPDTTAYMASSNVYRCGSRDGWLVYAPHPQNKPVPIARVDANGARPLDVIARGVLGCTRDVVAVATADAIELRDAHAFDRVLARIPARGYFGAAFAGQRVVVHQAGGTLEVFSTAGVLIRARNVGEIGAFALDDSGNVLYEQEGTLFLWAGAEPRRLAVHAPGFIVRAIVAERGLFLVRGTTTRLSSASDAALLVDRVGNVVRMFNADAAPQLVNGRLLTADAAGFVIITDTRDGSTLRLHVPEFHELVALTDHRVVMVSSSLRLIRVIELDAAPRDPSALRAWLRTASNARIEPGSTFASFPEPE